VPAVPPLEDPTPSEESVSVAAVQGGQRRLVGCIILSSALGTVHAWSLFLESFEARLDVGRGPVSAIYSIALVAITAAVLVGHRIFSRLSGWSVVLLSTGGAVAGLLLAAEASSWWVLLVGYGLLFGLANGLGYAFALQRSAEALPRSTGSALALVTAAYALGSTTAAVLLDGPIENRGPGHGLRILALTVGLAGLVAATLVGTSRSAVNDHRNRSSTGWRPVLRLWVAYGLAVLAGLMVLGHAAAIVDQAGGPGGTTVALAGFASAAGGAWMAWMGRGGHRCLMVGLPMVTAALLVVGGLASNGTVAVAVVAGVAFAYGSVIAVYPAVVHDQFGVDGYPSAYGRMFTAWGVAGLVGPVGAGLLFEVADTYRLPMLLAAVAAACSGLMARRVVS